MMESTSKMYEKIALDASKTIETIFGFFRVMPQIWLAEEDGRGEPGWERRQDQSISHLKPDDKVYPWF